MASPSVPSLTTQASQVSASITAHKTYHGLPGWTPQPSKAFPGQPTTVTITGNIVFATNPVDPGSGTLGFSDTNDARQWYSQPVFVLMAWFFIAYSIVSFLTLIMMISKGVLDWKLNPPPEVFSWENDDIELLGMIDTRNTSEDTRREELEPRANISDNGRGEDGVVEWWEAVEMHPFRRNPVAHTRTRLGSRRQVYGTGDLVSAQASMLHHQSGADLSQETLRRPERMLREGSRPDIRLEARRQAEIEWRLQRVGLCL